MSDQKTITESEVEEFVERFFSEHNVRHLTVNDSCRAALTALGFTIVPDPIPEPQGAVIVRDGEGNYWTHRSTAGYWTTPAVRGSLLWGELLHERGPVEIYEKRES